MEYPAHYESDILFFFEGKPAEHALYETLINRVAAHLPGTSLKVQKSQISLYNRHLFAAVSLPVRRRKDWPAHCIVVTFGLGHKLDAPRIAVATEPYPNRWTHHVLLRDAGEADGELLGWLQEAYDFSMQKR